MAPPSSPKIKRRQPPTQPSGELRDHLTPLPNEMVSQILRRRPTRDAVRTCCLGRAWRRRWATCPDLEFRFSNANDWPASTVDAVLDAHAGPIRLVEIHVPTESFPRAVGWLSLLAGKGVRSLIARFHGDLKYHPVIPAGVFSAGAAVVTTLEVVSCHVQPLPSNFCGLPNLKSLTMNNVQLPEHGGRTVEVLISRSPLLENLDITNLIMGVNPNAEGQQKWLIRAPNLKALLLMSRVDLGWETEEFPSLETARIILSGPQFARILPSLRRAMKLFVSWFAEENIPQGLPYSLGLLPCCLNMNSLSIFIIFPLVLPTLYLLRNAPSLNNIHITVVRDFHNEMDEQYLEAFNVHWVIRIVSHLKTFRLDGIRGYVNELQLIEWFLSKAISLDRLTISVHDDNPESREIVSTEVAKYTKSSLQATVDITLFPGYEVTYGMHDMNGDPAMA